MHLAHPWFATRLPPAWHLQLLLGLRQHPQDSTLPGCGPQDFLYVLVLGCIWWVLPKHSNTKKQSSGTVGNSVGLWDWECKGHKSHPISCQLPDTWAGSHVFAYLSACTHSVTVIQSWKKRWRKSSDLFALKKRAVSCTVICTALAESMVSIILFINQTKIVFLITFTSLWFLNFHHKQGTYSGMTSRTF